jgi:hypothetical protein
MLLSGFFLKFLKPFFLFESGSFYALLVRTSWTTYFFIASIYGSETLDIFRSCYSYLSWSRGLLYSLVIPFCLDIKNIPYLYEFFRDRVIIMLEISNYFYRINLIRGIFRLSNSNNCLRHPYQYRNTKN